MKLIGIASFAFIISSSAIFGANVDLRIEAHQFLGELISDWGRGRTLSEFQYGVLFKEGSHESLRTEVLSQLLNMIRNKEGYQALKAVEIFLRVKSSTPEFDSALSQFIEGAGYDYGRLLQIVATRHLISEPVTHSLFNIIRMNGYKKANLAVKTLRALNSAAHEKMSSFILSYPYKAELIEKLQSLVRDESRRAETAKNSAIKSAAESGARMAKELLGEVETVAGIPDPIRDLTLEINSLLRGDLRVSEDFVRSNSDFCRALIAATQNK